MMSFRLSRWVWAIVVSAFFHVFLLKNTVVLFPTLSEIFTPEMFFLGPILISPEVQGDWLEGKKTEGVSDGARDRRFWKGESRFANAIVDKPGVSVRKRRSLPQDPEKTIFPIEDVVFSENSSSRNEVEIPQEAYQPLRLEWHDSN